MLEYFTWLVDVWNSHGPRVNVLEENSGLNKYILIDWHCGGSVQCPGNPFQAYISEEKESSWHSSGPCKIS